MASKTQRQGRELAHLGIVPNLLQCSANTTYKCTFCLPQPRPGDALGPAYGTTVERQLASELSACLSQGQAMHLAQLVAMQFKDNLQVNNLFPSGKGRAKCLAQLIAMQRQINQVQ